MDAGFWVLFLVGLPVLLLCMGLGYQVARETNARGLKAVGMGAATGALSTLVGGGLSLLLRGPLVLLLVLLGPFACLGALLGAWAGAGENRPEQ